MSIGNAVAWLIALYTERGVPLLLWDVPFATIGAALCAISVAWIEPKLVVVGLVTAGPVCAALMIIAGNAIRRALWLGRPPLARAKQNRPRRTEIIDPRAASAGA